jgi:hypothetical protein
VRNQFFGFATRAVAGALAIGFCALALPSVATAGAKVFEGDDYSVELGLRIQPRMEFEMVPRFPATRGGKDWQRDFLVRRTRFKVNGKMMKASYNFEWRIDNNDQIGVSQTVGAENAWILYPLGRGCELKVGLYDQPFSRDRLTSDSRQLAVDRGAVSNVPNVFGLVDNAFGFQFQGRVKGGRFDYAFGGFDNRTITGPFQDVPMLVGRIDLNLGATNDIFRDAHFGTAKWYSLGLNGSWQGSIEDATGANDGENRAIGVDGMIDVPLGPGRFFARGEANNLMLVPPPGGNSLDTQVWMLGAGYLMFNQRFQPIVRFDETLLDDSVGGGTSDIMYVGANWYQKGHNLKIQGDVRFQSSTGESVDGMRLQAQIDY